MTVGPGGPDNATEVMGLGLYRNAFTYGKFGYASAMGVAMFFLTLHAGGAAAAGDQARAGGAGMRTRHTAC